MVIGVILLFGLIVYQIATLEYSFNHNDNVISIEKSLEIADIAPKIGKSASDGFYIVASKSGTKYYYQNCTGLDRIKHENRVFFASETEAEGRGLSLAKNCKKP